jgi:hypothetical protein
LAAGARTLAHIIINWRAQTQQHSLWKAVENLVDSHAAAMVQKARAATRQTRHGQGALFGAALA